MAIAEFDYHSNGGLALGVNYDPRLWMERNGIDPTSSLDAARKIWDRWDHAEVYRPDHETLGWTVHLFENANVSRYQHTGFAATEELVAVAEAMRNAVIRDDEGEFPRLFDLLDFSGENKAHTVVYGLARAAIIALDEVRGR